MAENSEIDEETDERPPAPAAPAPLDEDDEATIVRPVVVEEYDDDDEATIVRPLWLVPVDEVVEDDEATVVRPARVTVDDGDDDEATIVRPVRAGAQGDADDDLDERTTVVDRTSTAPDDGTIVVDRTSTAPDDGTIIVDRSSAAPDDGTVVVSRDKPAARKPGVPGLPSRRSNKRRITLPPVEPGFGREAVEASGPGAVSTYEPRLIPDVPQAAAEVELGADATRADAPSMPSVVKRSRRMGLIGIVGFALACVLSVVGLVIFAVLLFGS